ncbi:TnsA-like heteromeric transposase endonuclease subunit [Streptomyces sp. NBC_00638]|uniref:TnsA-like heteromeric transposase endonuclease subunit n=1 Tax=Streptomyces sp. NBC_00638 TaxID=2975794 RepID=UPI002251835B|nr:TnsA-like heteromeric transposase endonuclease subunit [Streptomyces sp. NBC_00638]MCX5006742.1 TnsA-like heteromeric transposase endonuclease subunit [Streptomyces sp. NBC_00638]
MVWSDACRFEDLALLHTGFTDCTHALDLDEKWPVRWTATWKFGRTPISSPVRDLDKVDLQPSVPVRRFTWRTDQFHRPGLEYLMATDRHHGFESHEEERLLLLSDFAAGLVEALSQPFRLRFFAGGKAIQHTPDFMLVTESGLFLIDVRPAGRIEPEDALKFAAAAETALSAGWRYGVVMGWHQHVWTNVDALSAERRPLPDVLEIQAQLRNAAAQGPLPYGELVEHCRIPAIGRAHALHLLWHRHLGVDLSVPFGDASLVRLAPQQHHRELAR